MKEHLDKMGPKRVTAYLKVLSAVQVVFAVSILTVILLVDNKGSLDLVGEEIVMPGGVILSVAVTLLLLLTASGVVALLKVPYGWVFSFFTATVLLLMTFLLGPGTITLTRMSFFTMMALSLMVWAQSVLYYHWDIYS